MLVIGLSGGTSEKRMAIAQRLEQQGGQQLKAFAILGSRLGDGRARTVERALEGAATGRRPVQGLVFPHLLTAAEADVVRLHGGHVWHLSGPVSGVVAIKHDELLVTDREGGNGRQLDPLEALSEVLLKVQGGHP
ncbi:hypothetical protein [Azotobacter beijerinckii]|uniref:Uncharacterized protein n=1 Tax=Azotobacter beijerinckii TaxID=170623 RepID=A0A1I4G9J0_9GAMM|nr:hypothetical protein [Azotobacter beijerinckii]SFB46279.1 hypothetical protein SAMN04244571_02991 [Azotobacter beijerinckii]SFL26715.1 hypothetical protein SAMN04244574_03737 [Azotobacter beijerinckii]